MKVVEEIGEIAARWVVRAHARPLNEQEQRELETWLELDPRHRGAYVRASAQWIDLDRLGTLRGPPRRLTRDFPNTQVEAETSLLVSRRNLLAAGIAAFTVLGGGMSWFFRGRGVERYVSEVGNVRRIPLSDGSMIVLNTDTEMFVHMTERTRDIELVRGEVLFEVAHDNTRPFVVDARGMLVKAVGTAFAVRLDAERMGVTVTEGVVEVSEPITVPTSNTAASQRISQRVGANERAVVASGQPPELQSIDAEEARRQLAWIEGMVAFDGESLQEAVNEINRHNRRKIVIDDATLAGKPVVGVFRTNDLEGFAVAAATALKARVVLDDDLIRLEQIASLAT